MTERRGLAQLAGLLIIAVAVITIAVGSLGVAGAHASAKSSSTKVSFQVLPAATTTLPATTITTTPVRSIPSPAPSSGGNLAFTGAPSMRLALIAVGLTVTGALLVAATRRRRTDGSVDRERP